MKNQLVVLIILLSTLSIQSQEKKVKIISGLIRGIEIFEDSTNPTYQNNFDSTQFTCRVEGIIITKLESNYYLPFKIYEINGKNLNTQQDIYNAIRAKVPGVRITNTNLDETPRINIRGDENTTVIVDGIRYRDTAILNTLNPSDIAKIEVTNNVAASNYLRTKINQ